MPQSYQAKLDKQRLNQARKKVQIIKYYSKNRMECRCCGEKNITFLTLDHVNDDGKKDRKKYLYNFLLDNHFPNGFQVLCYNCNIGKSRFKQCPHKGYYGISSYRA